MTPPDRHRDPEDDGVEEPTEHGTMIEDCEKRESRLTDWERDFIASVSEQLGRGRGLTPKQAETLERIWDKATERG